MLKNDNENNSQTMTAVTIEEDGIDIFLSKSEVAQTVFKKVTGGASPLLISKRGHERWTKTKDCEIFTSITAATFSPDESGSYHLDESQFYALHAVILNDVGSDVPIDLITIDPNIVMGSDVGSCLQLVYLLLEPICDIQKIKEFNALVVDAGLCTKGYSLITSEIEFPDANKETQCQLINVDRFTIEQLKVGLNLKEFIDEFEEKIPALEANFLDFEFIDDSRQVFVRRKIENPVITKLKQLGGYISAHSGGIHQIKCPWQENHGAQEKNQTMYKEPDHTLPVGGFKCSHEKCKKLGINLFLKELEISEIEAANKHKILIEPGKILQITNAIEKILCELSDYYVVKGSVVKVHRGLNFEDVKVEPLEEARLTHILSENVCFLKQNSKNDDEVIDPPPKYVKNFIGLSQYSHLRNLNGIAKQPHVSLSGDLVMQSGYDSKFGILSIFDPDLYEVPINPSFEDALNSLQILRELLSEFPFANPYDESAAISGLLCAAQRRVLPTAPMYFVTAPDFGTGKSFLCSVMAAIATEKKSTPFTFPSTKEECQKMLLAELRVMPEVIEFDNLVDDLVPHPMLCSALTSQQISDRVLGSSKIISAPTNTFFTGSGTNVRPIKDMMRRTITVELDSKCETPATRKFKRNPLKELLSNRPYYISAILTIIRAWFLAGKPIGSCKPIASYVDWGECCRHPLIWLGLPDPAQSMFRFMARDPDDVLLGQLLEVWHLIFKSKPKMVRDVVKRAQEDSDTDLLTILQEIAGDKFGNIDNKSLGHWIKKKSGKVIKNLRLVQSDTNLHAAQWKVEEIKK